MMRVFAYYALWLAFFCSSITVLYSALSLYQINGVNQIIRLMNSGKDAGVDPADMAAPEMKLAHAVLLNRKHRSEEALAQLGTIIDEQNPDLQTRVRYNLGNIYLRQALEATQAEQFDDAIALTELAKRAYRQTLALKPTDWDAKYNMEVAMRLMPEMDRINISEEQETPKDAKPLTTVPGFPRGLP